MRIIGFRKIYKRIKNLKEIYSFRLHNKSVAVDNSLRLRLPQYIHCAENVVIGENSRLLCWDSYNGKTFEKSPKIEIGAGTHATRNLTIQCANYVHIGENVLIASDVFIVDYNHGMNPSTDCYLNNELAISSGIIIEEGAWIGNNAVILPGVHIGRKSIIGAGAVVTKDIAEYSLAVGNPAKVIKHYDFKLNSWVEVKNE